MGLDKKSFFIRKRILLGYIYALVFIIFAKAELHLQTKLLTFIIGLEIVLAGEMLRLWASGYLRKGEILVTSGPFNYVRHPLYLGSFVIGAGFCIAVSNVLLFALFLIVFGIVYNDTYIYEENILQEKFGAEFIEYRNKVPRFLPSFERYRDDIICDFSIKQIIKNKEYMACIGILAVVAIIYLKHLQYIRR